MKSAATLEVGAHRLWDEGKRKRPNKNTLTQWTRYLAPWPPMESPVRVKRSKVELMETGRVSESGGRAEGTAVG